MINDVINGVDTYKQIANDLIFNNSSFIGWSDEEYTHFDILFTYKKNGVPSCGGHQSGIRSNYLFVSILGVNSTAFRTDTLLDVGYVSEKLFNNRVNTSVKKITELINGVIIAL